MLWSNQPIETEKQSIEILRKMQKCKFKMLQMSWKHARTWKWWLKHKFL